MLQNLQNSYSDSSSTTSSSSEEEDYINMEVDDHHHSSIFKQSSNNEFEFQQSFSSSSDRDPHATTSPADELFYMGKLLPLHLPPRLEMVHKILQSSAVSFDAQKGVSFDDEAYAYATPFLTPTATTPFQSCNISPSESCEVSRELTPEEHLVEYISAFDEKKSWTKKMKTFKQSSSSSSSKIKWTTYIKSLFTKSSGCTNEQSAAAAAAEYSQFSKANQSFNKNSKNSAPFGQIKYRKNFNLVEDEGGRHRRSFSGAIKGLSKTKSSMKSSSSSTSISAKNNLNLVVFKRSISSAATEIESPIQGAIAHCKRSQNSRQIADEGRFCSISGSS
ncbi:hypothetical protein C2S52_019401 [Perilla frutescens var. hirtella]|nr:hypothetical protein C2S52_019401 [Perilla frutescens var. hirtella]KAH6806324.1 hypothetical protein C2S51_031155 [Perilla frutescens var. frutescens]